MVRSLEERIAPAIFTVDQIGDSGGGSLRGAINDVNSSVDPTNSIVFDSTVFNTPLTIDLASGQLTLTKPVTITGPGMNSLTIRNIKAAGADSRIFNISGGTTVQMTDLTLSGGNVTTNTGGAILSTGVNLQLTNVALTGNREKDRSPMELAANRTQRRRTHADELHGVGQYRHDRWRRSHIACHDRERDDQREHAHRQSDE